MGGRSRTPCSTVRCNTSGSGVAPGPPGPWRTPYRVARQAHRTFVVGRGEDPSRLSTERHSTREGSDYGSSKSAPTHDHVRQTMRFHIDGRIAAIWVFILAGIAVSVWFLVIEPGREAAPVASPTAAPSTGPAASVTPTPTDSDRLRHGNTHTHSRADRRLHAERAAHRRRPGAGRPDDLRHPTRRVHPRRPEHPRSDLRQPLHLQHRRPSSHS